MVQYRQPVITRKSKWVRQEFCTNNNAFILRWAIDRAQASGQSLYVMNALGGRNFMSINAVKSYVMVFGPLPDVIPKFFFDGSPVTVTHHQTYVGVSFTLTSRNIFDNHYKMKASKA
jgi:hypothetical protein